MTSQNENRLRNLAGKANFPLESAEFAKYMDKHHDPIAHLRQEFLIPKIKDLPHVDVSIVDDPESEGVYLCGNSLGLQPKGTQQYFEKELDKWAKMGVEGHFNGEFPWALCDEKVVPGNARIVGAKDTEVAVMNSLTVNVHVLLVTFYKPEGKRNKILLEKGAFPSDHYAIESQMRIRGVDPKQAMVCIEPKKDEHTLRTEDILAAVDTHKDELALVMFSGVQYYTGQLFDIPTITKYAQDRGIIVGWDLAHAAGNVPLQLHDWNVDFACWCSYKYMNTGAGGLAGAFIHQRHANNEAGTRMLGWWSHNMQTRFVMNNELDLSPGALGYRISNPPIFLVCPMAASLDVFAKTDMQTIRQKSYLLTGYLEYLLTYHLGEHSAARKCTQFCTIFTPSEPDQRGAQLSLSFNVDVEAVFKQLGKMGVVCDFRRPSVVRIAPAPLYNSFHDVYRFVNILMKCLQ